MSELKTQLPTDTWIGATWEDYQQAIANLETAKSYYYKGRMRLEMSPVSSDHGRYHIILIFAVNLFATIKGIPVTGFDTTTFRKTGFQECQPDIAYYLRDNAQTIPVGGGIVNLDFYPRPDLVIEIAKTSLLDDLGTKRSLYESLGVAEYWVVDVQNTQVLAYAIANQGSQLIQESLVFPGLKMSILTAALKQSREMDQSQVGVWLLSQFQLP
jgi:Uma2 family endonuclease